MIDAAALGALVGIGFMSCLVLVVCCNDKKEYLLAKWKRYRQIRQPLLPVVVINPPLVRSSSKQWKMKEIIPQK